MRRRYGRSVVCIAPCLSQAVCDVAINGCRRFPSGHSIGLIPIRGDSPPAHSGAASTGHGPVSSSAVRSGVYAVGANRVEASHLPNFVAQAPAVRGPSFFEAVSRWYCRRY